MHFHKFATKNIVRGVFLLNFYLFIIPVLNAEVVIKRNPLKVSINSTINQSLYDLIIYNDNKIITHKAKNKEIVNIQTLPKGRYTLTLKSGNFIKGTKFIELVDSIEGEGVEGVNDILYLNVSDLQEAHPDLYRSSPEFPPLLHYYDNVKFKETELAIDGDKYKLMALPAGKKLWAKYNILIDDSLIEWNEIQINRLMTILSNYNDFLSNNSNLPISIWKLTNDNDFKLTEKESIYKLSLPVKYFVETVRQLDSSNIKSFYYKLEESVYKFVNSIFNLPDDSNFLYNIDFYSKMNANFTYQFEKAFKEDAINYFEEFNKIETDIVNNSFNFIGFKTKLLEKVRYSAKANKLKSHRFDSNDIDENKFIEQCILFYSEDFVESRNLYKETLIAFLDQYFEKYIDNDFYIKWIDAQNWNFDINDDKWTNNGLNIKEYYGIICDSPKNAFTANIIYFLYNDEFSPACGGNTQELLSSILFDSDITGLSYDTQIKNTSISIRGKENQNKVIYIELEAKLVDQGSNLRKIDLLIKNNFGFFEIMTLIPSQEDINSQLGYINLNSTLEINKNTRSALYYVDGINFSYGENISDKFNFINCELVFPVFNSSQDLSPPEIIKDTLKFTMNTLGEQGTELTVSFDVREDYSMSSDLNSFIYIKSPGINSFYIEILGYGIDSGSTGYFTESSQCILKTILPSYYPSGEYTIMNIELIDKANNISRYTTNDLLIEPKILSFNLSNINPDLEPPVIDKNNIIIKLQTATENSPEVSSRFPVIFMNVEDIYSGVGEAIFTITDSDQNEYSIYTLPENLFLEMLNTDEQKIYNTAFPVYHKFDNIDEGLILSSLKIRDNAHNATALDEINLTFDFSTFEKPVSDSSTELKWKVIGEEFGFYFKTSIDFSYRIEKSNDLINWSFIQEVIGNDANYYFIENLDKEENLIFYRTTLFKKN